MRPEGTTGQVEEKTGEPFAALYQFQLQPGKEAEYIVHWETMVNYLKKYKGAIGSNLTKMEGQDNWFLAYSLWPNMETNEKSWPITLDGSQEAADAKAAEIAMGKLVIQHKDKLSLQVKKNLLSLDRFSVADKNKILIYDNDLVSTGTTSIRELYMSLLAVVNPRYSIERVYSDYLNKQDWAPYTALLIIPGGRARPHYINLADGGNKKIIDYVHAGGKYLGLCAGGYYGSAETVFERGGDLAVHDEGPLNFYPGTAEGPAYGLNKFRYKDESGAQLAKINFVATGKIQYTLQTYFNGGCFFHSQQDAKNVQVLARYQDINSQPAAIVESKVGMGIAILSGVHFEYSHNYVKHTDKIMYAHTTEIADQLKMDQSFRLNFFAGILKRLDVCLHSDLQFLHLRPFDIVPYRPSVPTAIGKKGLGKSGFFSTMSVVKIAVAGTGLFILGAKLFMRSRSNTSSLTPPSP